MTTIWKNIRLCVWIWCIKYNQRNLFIYNNFTIANDLKRVIELGANVYSFKVKKAYEWKVFEWYFKIILFKKKANVELFRKAYEIWNQSEHRNVY